MHHSNTATNLASLAANQVDGLASGDMEQHLPQVVAVVQPWEPADRDGTAETVERGKGHILLVRRGSRHSPEPCAGEADEPCEVPIPQRLGGCRVASLEFVQP